MMPETTNGYSSVTAEVSKQTQCICW